MDICAFFNEAITEWIHSPTRQVHAPTSLGTTMRVSSGVIRISNNLGVSVTVEEVNCVPPTLSIEVISSPREDVSAREVTVNRYTKLTKVLIAAFGYDPLPYLAPSAVRMVGATAVVDATRYTLNRICGVDGSSSTYSEDKVAVGYIVNTPATLVTSATERYLAVSFYCELRERASSDPGMTIELREDNVIRVHGSNGWVDLTLFNPNLPNAGFDHVVLLDHFITKKSTTIGEYKFLYLSSGALNRVLEMIGYYQPYPSDKWDKVDFLSTTNEGTDGYGLVSDDCKSNPDLLRWRDATLGKALERHPSANEREIMSTGALVAIHEIFDEKSEGHFW